MALLEKRKAKAKKANRLINEKSPYLLQHAHNPVDWYPWGNEAFERAKQEDKPIFISIGYSTCHWCHVMERESFEDEEVAALLNKNFVSIKVDREERPDVDNLYMDACLALNGSGGWPLSCFVTHDKKPFFAGTYFPKNDGLHGTGFMTILENVSDVWKNNRSEIAEHADLITRHLERQDKKSSGLPDNVSSAFQHLASSFDEKYGGFSRAPKFPSPHMLLFLMRYGREHHENKAFDMVRKTLDCMYQGGIYDHIGGGFCRYSTDRQWLVPHFEKMMTDNALHIIAYSEASALFGGEYSEIARDITRFCQRDMLDPSGGFYTATDADSEGVEGEYYTFTIDEVESILGKEDGQKYCKLYNITRHGNFDNKSIPNLIDSGILEEDMEFAKSCNAKMLLYRSKREPPFRDDKALLLVNGLMTAALAIEGRILHDDNIIEMAKRCAAFMLSKLAKEGRLMTRWRMDEAGIPANSDDYACLIWGLIELYEATLSPEWLEKAVQFTEAMYPLFWDNQAGGFYLTGSDVDDLPIRQKSVVDGALPSGNSIMAMNLLRLARLCGNEKYEEDSNQIIHLAAPIINSQPAACCWLLSSFLYLKNGGTEVILTRGNGFEQLQGSIPVFMPFTAVAACGEGNEEILNVAPFLGNYHSVEGKAAAYVCRNGACMKPITSHTELAGILKPM